jgi:hypothetical protein
VFQSDILPPSAVYNSVYPEGGSAVYSIKTLVPAYKTTWCQPKRPKYGCSLEVTSFSHQILYVLLRSYDIW